MPGTDQCVFCQLVDSPQQTLVVHETEKFKAWLDINPRARGHTLVVPKDHLTSPAEIGEGLNDMFDVARIVGEKAINGLGADGYSIVVNKGEIAGQNLDHFYMIVFPRFEEEETAGTPTGAIFRPMEDVDENDLQEFHTMMKDASFAEYGSREKTKFEEMQEEKEEGESVDQTFWERDAAEFR